MLSGTAQMTLRGTDRYVNHLMAEPLIIRSEADLWTALRNIPEIEAIPGTPLLQIAGWKPNLLYFPTEPLGHTLSPSLARAVAGYHNSLSRAYAYVSYGQSDSRFLKLQDIDALDIRLLSFAGSNGLQVFDNALDRLTHSLLSKFSGKQMFVLAVIFLLMHFGETAMKDWIHEESLARMHEADDAQTVKLSEQETERMDLLKSILASNPPWKPLKSLSDEGRIPLLRGTLAYDRAEVLGVPVTRDQARAIVQKDREKAQGKRLDGRFEVVEIDVDNPEGFSGVLRDMKTHLEVRVSINLGELPSEDLHTLFLALEKKGSVDALVNAWMIGEKVTYASIVRANPVP